MDAIQNRLTPDRPIVLALSVPDAARAAARSRARMFELIRDGAIKAKKDGASTIITIDELQRWLSSLPERAATAA